jgi:hypothetical protein
LYRQLTAIQSNEGLMWHTPVNAVRPLISL